MPFSFFNLKSVSICESMNEWTVYFLALWVLYSQRVGHARDGSGSAHSFANEDLRRFPSLCELCRPAPGEPYGIDMFC